MNFIEKIQKLIDEEEYVSHKDAMLMLRMIYILASVPSRIMGDDIYNHKEYLPKSLITNAWLWSVYTEQRRDNV